MNLVLLQSESHNPLMLRPIFIATLLVMLVPCLAVAQFDEQDPVFSVKKREAVPEAKPALAVDIRQELRPLMDVELGFIKRVCKPTPEQKKQITAAADACMNRLNEIAVLNQAEQGSGITGGSEVVAVTAEGIQLTENPIEKIQQEMAAALRSIVTAEQHAAYVDEAALRTQAKRRAVVAVAIVLLDRHLVLRDEQRKTLNARLLDEWDEAENIPMQTYFNNHQYFPELPEEVLHSELDEEQLVIWKSLNKTRFPLYISTISMGFWEEDFLE